jgi:hypothetical protein
MNNQLQSLKPFSQWAQEIQAKHSEILEHWLNGSDPYKIAMAKTILAAGDESNKKEQMWIPYGDDFNGI